jgi:hypothetical protein
MDFSIPSTPQEILELKQSPVSPETVARAIAGVIQVARSKGQSLDELTAEVLMDDCLLDSQQRSWLCKVLTDAWNRLPLRTED